MIRVVTIFAALLCGPLSAEPVAVVGSHPAHTENNSTALRLGPPTDPAAIATLTYTNRGNNHRGDTGYYYVTWQDIYLSIYFEWNAYGAADRIEVETQAGYVAIPRTLTLLELERGEVQIMKWEGM